MMRTGIAFLWSDVEDGCPEVLVSRARGCNWPSTSKAMQICLIMSAMEPVVATTGTTRYREGWSLLCP